MASRQFALLSTFFAYRMKVGEQTTSKDSRWRLGPPSLRSSVFEGSSNKLPRSPDCVQNGRILAAITRNLSSYIVLEAGRMVPYVIHSARISRLRKKGCDG